MIQEPFYGYILGAGYEFLVHSTSDLPIDAVWMPGLVLLILGAAAIVDTITATIPDALIFLGLLAITAVQGMYVSWPFASAHLTVALIAAACIWAVNYGWYHFFKRDAIGMGDAKWTMMAVACFDVTPVLFAWGIGACMAILWMGVLRITRYHITRVYFAPFLFLGLLAGIYWLRVR